MNKPESDLAKTTIQKLIDSIDELLQYVADLDSGNNDDKAEHLEQATNELESAKTALEEALTEYQNFEAIK